MIVPDRLYDVGGVMLPRPFKIRRLGHFGISVDDVEATLPFYTDILGFDVSDSINFNRIFNLDDAVVGPGVGYLLRHGPEHHSFVLFPLRPMLANPKVLSDMTGQSINQITWQVGSLREVAGARQWFADCGLPISRQGRDTPGSNWHCYPVGLDGHVNEVFYGIEIIGWDGYSKPPGMHPKRYEAIPELPHVSERSEVDNGFDHGVKIVDGVRARVRLLARFDVGGVMMPRPFKIVRMGPVRIFVKDLDRARRMYSDILGLSLTEEVLFEGHRCLFFRTGNEHHSLGVYPIELRSILGFPDFTSHMSYGLQVADYRQLQNAVAFIEEHGFEVRRLPAALFPGMGPSAFAVDPSSHAVQLYHSMEQIGWDGQPRKPHQRMSVDNEHWPDRLDSGGDSYTGEAFLGPWY
jgi:catechol 2,3-dioxygenase-like lactoylglutathione lyase family enzyme